MRILVAKDDAPLADFLCQQTATRSTNRPDVLDVLP
jgi:hypothetical protein